MESQGGTVLHCQPCAYHGHKGSDAIHKEGPGSSKHWSDQHLVLLRCKLQEVFGKLAKSPEQQIELGQDLTLAGQLLPDDFSPPGPLGAL